MKIFFLRFSLIIIVYLDALMLDNVQKILSERCQDKEPKECI